MFETLAKRMLSLSLAAVLAAGGSARAQRERPELPPETIWADRATGVTFSPDVPLGAPRLAEYPDIAATGDRVFSAWTEYAAGADVIRFAEITAGTATDAETISADAELACWPALAADPQGNVWAAWSAKSQDRWRVAVRRVFPERAEAPILLPAGGGTPGADCFQPVIACTRQRVFVAWMEMSRGACRIVATSFQDPGQSAPPFIVSGGGFAFRPALAARDDACWIAWDEVAETRQYEVFLARLEAERVAERLPVTRHPALDAAAALAIDREGRVWVAWHSDRSRSRQWDIPKWPQLRCYDHGQWRQPLFGIPGQQEDPRGEDQGFEFPVLCLDGVDGLWLFGRPSHGFNAVRLAGDTCSSIYRFARPGWGGRGYHVRAVAVGTELWTVRRDLERIMVARILVEPERSAAPALVALRDAPPPELPPVAEPPDAFADPVFPRDSPIVQRPLFGDVHMHTALSDGMGTVDELYHRARYGYGYDFATVTDHDDFVGNRILPSEWAYLQAVADLHDDPPHFVTLCAFEWTDARFPKGDGHKNVYYLDHGPLLWHTDPAVEDGPKLFARLQQARGICFPHHIGWTGVNWENQDPMIQANVEICSVHGAYEYRGNTPIAPRGDMAGCFVQDGLGRGLVFGLVGGSDSHGLAWHHGIARRRNPWTQGLTGIFASERSRAGIWRALAARNCYATSGPKVVVDLQVAAARPGSVTTITEPPLITAWAVAPTPIDQVEIIKNGQTIFTSREDAETTRLRYTDYDWPATGSNSAYYYLRVTLRNQELAWTSPVFVRFNTDGADAAANLNSNAPGGR